MDTYLTHTHTNTDAHMHTHTCTRTQHTPTHTHTQTYIPVLTLGLIDIDIGDDARIDQLVIRGEWLPCVHARARVCECVCAHARSCVCECVCAQADIVCIKLCALSCVHVLCLTNLLRVDDHNNHTHIQTYPYS